MLCILRSPFPNFEHRIISYTVSEHVDSKETDESHMASDVQNAPLPVNTLLSLNLFPSRNKHFKDILYKIQ